MLSGACDLGSLHEGNIECEVLPLFLTPFLSSYLLHFWVRHILKYFILEYYMHYISLWKTEALKFNQYIWYHIYIIFHIYVIYVCMCVYLPLTKKIFKCNRVLSTSEPLFLLRLKAPQSMIISALRNSDQLKACWSQHSIMSFLYSLLSSWIGTNALCVNDILINFWWNKDFFFNFQKGGWNCKIQICKLRFDESGITSTLIVLGIVLVIIML